MNATAELRFIARDGAQVRRHPRAIRPSRLAVIPFDDLTADEHAAPIADALTVLIVANLACRDALDVVSDASIMQCKGEHFALAEMARARGADRILVGAVLRQGGQLQVLVQLVDAHSGESLLVRTYTGQPAAIERAQTAIAWAVADDLADAVRAA